MLSDLTEIHCSSVRFGLLSWLIVSTAYCYNGNYIYLLLN